MPPATRTLVLGDLHLVRESPADVAEDLARLIAAHPGARLVFAGDLFDLPMVSPRRPHREIVVDALAAHPTARAALGRHLDQGGELWLLGGNHDAEVASAGFAQHLVGALGASPAGAAQVRTSPWFFREGGLHLEHGHFYDPDNAPAHPLVRGQRSLGVHFVEEFIAPAGAHRYLQAIDDTPLKLLVAAFQWYGPRAWVVVYRYFYAAFAALLESGPFYGARGEYARGQALCDAFAEERGVSGSLLEDLLALGATPTMESLTATFSRLYFDRVIATLSLAAGAGALAAGHRKIGAGAALVGALLMTASWARGHDRYGGTVPELLAGAARRVAATTGAGLVVFGHSHREALEESYANTGSFAYPREAPGRPYLEIEGTAERPRAVRRYLVA